MGWSNTLTPSLESPRSPLFKLNRNIARDSCKKCRDFVFLLLPRTTVMAKGRNSCLTSALQQIIPSYLKLGFTPVTTTVFNMSFSGYTWPLRKMHSDCELYNRILSRKYQMLVDGQKTTCLFIKTHEPWYWNPKHSLIADKVTLLLRHPYDSAFAEFKRLVLTMRCALDLNLKILSYIYWLLTRL